MNGPDYTNRPQPWSWFIQDDPNPEKSEPYECVGMCDTCDNRTTLVLMDINANEAICRDCVTRLRLDPSTSGDNK